jgi:hypothetical protein
MPLSYVHIFFTKSTTLCQKRGTNHTQHVNYEHTNVYGEGAIFNRRNAETENKRSGSMLFAYILYYKWRN